MWGFYKKDEITLEERLGNSTKWGWYYTFIIKQIQLPGLPSVHYMYSKLHTASFVP